MKTTPRVADGFVGAVSCLNVARALYIAAFAAITWDRILVLEVSGFHVKLAYFFLVAAMALDGADRWRWPPEGRARWRSAAEFLRPIIRPPWLFWLLFTMLCFVLTGLSDVPKKSAGYAVWAAFDLLAFAATGLSLFARGTADEARWRTRLLDGWIGGVTLVSAIAILDFIAFHFGARAGWIGTFQTRVFEWTQGVLPRPQAFSYEPSYLALAISFVQPTLMIRLLLRVEKAGDSSHDAPQHSSINEKPTPHPDPLPKGEGMSPLPQGEGQGEGDFRSRLDFPARRLGQESGMEAGRANGWVVQSLPSQSPFFRGRWLRDLASFVIVTAALAAIFARTGFVLLAVEAALVGAFLFTRVSHARKAALGGSLAAILAAAFLLMPAAQRRAIRDTFLLPLFRRTDVSMNGRIYVWTEGFRFARERPLGSGPGTAMKRWLDAHAPGDRLANYPQNTTAMMSVWPETALEEGWAGLALIALFFVWLGVDLARNKSVEARGVFIAYLAVAGVGLLLMPTITRADLWSLLSMSGIYAAGMAGDKKSLEPRSRNQKRMAE